MSKRIDIQQIKDYMKKNKFSPKKFCKVCRIKREDLDKIFSGSIDFDIRIYIKIINVMNLIGYELFIKD